MPRRGYVMTGGAARRAAVRARLRLIQSNARAHLLARRRLVGIRSRLRRLPAHLASRMVSGPGQIAASMRYHTSRIAALRTEYYSVLRELQQLR